MYFGEDEVALWCKWTGVNVASRKDPDSCRQVPRLKLLGDVN
jgi:hypothetical protein